MPAESIFGLYATIYVFYNTGNYTVINNCNISVLTMKVIFLWKFCSQDTTNQTTNKTEFLKFPHFKYNPSHLLHPTIFKQKFSSCPTQPYLGKFTSLFLKGAQGMQLLLVIQYESSWHKLSVTHNDSKISTALLPENSNPPLGECLLKNMLHIFPS